MKRDKSDVLPPAQAAELAALAAVHDDQIDTRDIPEQRDWSGARRGVFYRPIKKQLTLRLDADLIDWFKARGESSGGYQTRINSALRAYVDQQSR
jgi:uncharacterized protein (DUF4415 family)